MATGRLTSADRVAFHAHLRRSSPLDEADLAAIDADATVRRLPAGALFLASGEQAVDCGAVLAGVVREYFPLEDGREVTRGFAGPGDYVGSLSDLLRDQPARSSIVAEVDSHLVVLPWRRIRDVAARRPAWAAFHARVTERLYLTKAEREYELLALDAEARYRRFRARYAALESAIPLRHVASYVGITPEHLSRLRRRLGIAAPRSGRFTDPGARRGSAAPRRTTR
jgi:CRP-like cAMP-binding protein